MEQQKLPNATVSLVLGILSYIACCFTSGIGGVILSGIALYLTNKDLKTYALDPELYNNYGQVKTSRIVAIVGLILGGLALLTSIAVLAYFGGIEGYKHFIHQNMQTST